MIPVKAVKDESSHWYVIPAEASEEFRKLEEEFLNTENYDVLDEFEEKFGKYRTGGDLNNVQLYAKLD